MTQGIFEVDAGTLENFLELLRKREEESKPTEDETCLRRAVFVAPLTRTSASDYGVPVVARRVRAGFAYGTDLVILTRLISDGYEFPKPADDTEKRSALQDEILSKTRAGIEEGASRLGLSVPVLDGWLRLPAPQGKADLA